MNCSESPNVPGVPSAPYLWSESTLLTSAGGHVAGTTSDCRCLACVEGWLLTPSPMNADRRLILRSRIRYWPSRTSPTRSRRHGVRGILSRGRYRPSRCALSQCFAAGATVDRTAVTQLHRGRLYTIGFRVFLCLSAEAASCSTAGIFCCIPA